MLKNYGFILLNVCISVEVCIYYHTDKSYKDENKTKRKIYNLNITS